MIKRIGLLVCLYCGIYSFACGMVTDNRNPLVDLCQTILQQCDEFNYSCMPLKDVYCVQDYAGEITRNKITCPVSAQMFLSAMDDVINMLKYNLSDNTTWVSSNDQDPIPQPAAIISTLEQPQQGIYVVALEAAPTTKVIVTSDYHGNVHAFIRNLYRYRNAGLMNGDFVLRDDVVLIINGDIADRGHYGVELWAVLFLLMIQNPHNVILVQGNHEEDSVAQDYGFYAELEAKLFASYDGQALRKRIRSHILSLWGLLPQAVFVGVRDYKGILNFAQCNHGGLPGPLLGQSFAPGYDGFCMLLEKVAEDHRPYKKYAFLQSRVPKRNGLTWNGFFAGAGSTTVKQGKRRDDFLHHGCTVSDYFGRLRSRDVRVSCIVRGHEHLDHGINQLQDVVPESIDHRKCCPGWAPFFKKIPLCYGDNSYPVLTITSMAEDFFKDAYVVLSFVPEARVWIATPCVYESLFAGDRQGDLFLRWKVTYNESTHSFDWSALVERANAVADDD
ncbi:MAG: Serine/threonine-protein phosphatase [candidate division TM6 bacterium GW2011_GWF2_38_10]|nr:MAG: Serine/threonine-protein phosphatase [candidate division TM6 bacterium GW2011_GWF2_38_10]